MFESWRSHWWTCQCKGRHWLQLLGVSQTGARQLRDHIDSSIVDDWNVFGTPVLLVLIVSTTGGYVFRVYTDVYWIPLSTCKIDSFHQDFAQINVTIVQSHPPYPTISIHILTLPERIPIFIYGNRACLQQVGDCRKATRRCTAGVLHQNKGITRGWCDPCDPGVSQPCSLSFMIEFLW